MKKRNVQLLLEELYIKNVLYNIYTDLSYWKQPDPNFIKFIFTKYFKNQLTNK